MVEIIKPNPNGVVTDEYCGSKGASLTYPSKHGTEAGETLSPVSDLFHSYFGR
jgi:hypothetical protein